MSAPQQKDGAPPPTDGTSAPAPVLPGDAASTPADAAPPGDAPGPEPGRASLQALPSPIPAGEGAAFDPNRNLVYDVLLDVADLELVGRLKWDIFSVEQRLDRALKEDSGLAGTDLKQELDLALELFRADEDVVAYKERFVRSESRLKLIELVRFLELAVRVREPLHRAWVQYLEFDHERLLQELAGVDREGLARRPGSLLAGNRETEARRCKAVIAHTERSARQIYAEIPFRDYGRIIAWYEEKNPQLANLVAEARVLYLQLGLSRKNTDIARHLRGVAWALAAFAAVTALAATAAFLR